MSVAQAQLQALAQHVRGPDALDAIAGRTDCMAAIQTVVRAAKRELVVRSLIAAGATPKMAEHLVDRGIPWAVPTQ